MGLNVNETFLHTLLFTDDQILIAADEYDIEYMMRKISETYDRAGLKVNVAKTKYLVVGDRQNNNLVINGQVIEVCNDYKYLGVTISGEGSSKKELSNRIGQAKQEINKLNSILWANNIKKQTRKRIYKTVVESLLLYGSEVWEITKRDKQRLEAVEMNFMRRSCRVSRLQRITNEEIKRRINKGKNVIEKMEERRLKWYGHVRRMEDHCWRKKILQWHPPCRRKRGRPPED
jgi:hypothetical protein